MDDVTSDAPKSKRLKLGDLRNTGGRTGFSTPVLTGYNMGNRTLSITTTLEKFREISEVANEARMVEMGEGRESVAQRPLDKTHAKKISLYMLRGLLSSVRKRWVEEGRAIPEELDDILADLGEGPYQGLQPITGNIRNCERDGDDLDLELSDDGKITVHFRQGQVIWVIDGQHRRYAYQLLVDWLEQLVQNGAYPSQRKGGLFIPEDRDDARLSRDEYEIWAAVQDQAKSQCTIDIAVHLGLKPEQERQLFHDLNNLGKKVDSSTAQAYDRANPVSIFTRKVLEQEGILGGINIIDAGSVQAKKKGLPKDGIFRDDVISVNALLFKGAANPAGVTPAHVNGNYDYGRRFWKAIASQPHFGEEDWEERTLLAQPVMLKGLAETAYKFRASREADPTALDSLLSALEAHEIDFGHETELWRIYLESEEERRRKYANIDDYLTPEPMMKPYATWDSAKRTLTFTSNTNDVKRYIGDLVRWKLGLPPRPAIAAARAKLAAT